MNGMAWMMKVDPSKYQGQRIGSSSKAQDSTFYILKARIRLQKVELEADEYRMNGYSEIEREKANLINATSISLEQLEKSKNETLYFEKQRAMNQVRQRVFQQAVQGALGTLNSCLNTELHFRTIRANIGILGSLEWKR